MNQSLLRPVVTVPLFPYIKPNRLEPIRTKRLRPQDSLDLKLLVTELEASKITTLALGQNPWSVISVYSPYSSDIHVMLMETRTDRYLPSPERVPDEEGDALVKLWLKITTYLRARPRANRIFIGYNWSPRSWGEEEEKTGFQSIPTKWHPMLWNWPAFPSAGEEREAVSWIATERLNPSLRRILGVHCDHTIMLETIKTKLDAVFDQSTTHLFGFKKIIIEQATVSIIFEKRIEDLLGIPCFFSKLLKPLAKKLNDLMTALAESFTDMNCSQIDGLISCAVKDHPNEDALQMLRRPPGLKPKDSIYTGLKIHDLPSILVDVLYEPIRSRCHQDGDPCNWWRKGFGYALVMGDRTRNNRFCHIRILPGVYVGPGGVVEAQGVVLQRPEDRTLSIEQIRKKSIELHGLQEYLENQKY